MTNDRTPHPGISFLREYRRTGRRFCPALLLVCALSVSGGEYFWPPIGGNSDIAELEALFDRKDDYQDPYTVCLHIGETMRHDTRKSPESRRLWRQIERYFDHCDPGAMAPEDQWHFLCAKALFHHFGNDENKMLETLKRFPLKPPYVIDDFHGAAGVKRNTVSAILADSFEQGLIRRPIRVFLSSFDVFTWQERIGGLFLLPFFAVKANPHCSDYWIWLAGTIAFSAVGW